VFSWFASNPGEARLFGAATTDLSQPVVRGAVSVIEIGSAKTVEDVGGADGAAMVDEATRKQFPGQTVTITEPRT
jgi:hypothetical protein